MRDSGVIGIYDSGLGGLTVLSAIHQVLPNESTVYLGDTARVPYGNRKPETITKYALANVRALLAYAPLKLLVLACNTITAVALKTLQDELKIPVIGVIEPGAQMATAAGDKIAVLATRATVQSRAYQEALTKCGHEGFVHMQACPLFVPLVEEGMVDGPIAREVADFYFRQLPKDLDTIVLGCTHYPLLLPLLQSMMPEDVKWVHSGEAVANKVKGIIGNGNEAAPLRKYLVTEAPDRYRQMFEFFLGKPVLKEQVELIDVRGI